MKHFYIRPAYAEDEKDWAVWSNYDPSKTPERRVDNNIIYHPYTWENSNWLENIGKCTHGIFWKALGVNQVGVIELVSKCECDICFFHNMGLIDTKRRQAENDTKRNA